MLTLEPATVPSPEVPLASRFGAWLSADVRPDDCVLRLDQTALDELRAMLRQIRRAPLPMLLRTPAQFELPRLTQVMRRVDARLGAMGVAVVDRLPMDELQAGEAATLFWCLGQLLAPNVAQKWDGTMLYDVTDTGARYSYGVRGSYTNVELVFHTDNAFGVLPPEYVGLLCLHPAKAGGVSRFCDLVAVHDRLLQTSPRLLARLYEPMLWDRQAEHGGGEPRVARAPMFRLHEGRFAVRANASLVRKGYEVAGEPMEPVLHEALQAFQAITEDPVFWFELPIERGQLQYIDNVRIAHYRSEFVDHDDPGLKRHLVRSWHRRHGLSHYDG